MSLENPSDGETYKESSNNGSLPESGGGDGTVQVEDGATGVEKPKKKVIYFADGSTMEDFDDDDDVPDKNQTRTATDSVTRTKRSVEEQTPDSAPPTDPSKLNWPEWVRHYSTKAGSKTLTVLEGMGGTAAYYLGITTPKYQSEIDEYNRMAAKKKSHEEELVSWSTGPKSPQEEPVVEDVKTNENGEIELTEKK